MPLLDLKRREPLALADPARRCPTLNWSHAGRSVRLVNSPGEYVRSGWKQTQDRNVFGCDLEFHVPPKVRGEVQSDFR